MAADKPWPQLQPPLVGQHKIHGVIFLLIRYDKWQARYLARILAEIYYPYFLQKGLQCTWVWNSMNHFFNFAWQNFCNMVWDVWKSWCKKLLWWENVTARYIILSCITCSWHQKTKPWIHQSTNLKCCIKARHAFKYPYLLLQKTFQGLFFHFKDILQHFIFVNSWFCFFDVTNRLVISKKSLQNK